MMEATKQNTNRIFWVISVLIIVLFFVLNVFTPLIADDYSMSLGKHSASDIIISAYNMYFGWGGSSIAFFLESFCLILGKNAFNISNTIVYCLFVLLMQFHICGNLKKINPIIFCFINVFLWFLIPAWGQNFLWLVGSCAYLWTSTTILFFLVPLRKKCNNINYNLNIPFSILYLFSGILAGWSNPNSSAAVLFLLIAYFFVKIFKKEKLSLFEILGAIGFLSGFVLLIAAPGNYARAEVIRQITGEEKRAGIQLLVLLITRFISITSRFIHNHGLLILFISVFLGVELVHHQKKKVDPFVYFYALTGLACAYSMVLSPTFPDRSYLMVFVFLGITLGNILKYIGWTVPQIVKRNWLLLSFFSLIIISLSVVKAGRNTIGIYLRWQNRIEYIMTEKEKGNLDIVVKAPIPATDRHTALYGLEDIAEERDGWTNTAIAEYYGIKSIKGLYNDDPWPSLWKPESF